MCGPIAPTPRFLMVPLLAGAVDLVEIHKGVGPNDVRLDFQPPHSPELELAEDLWTSSTSL